MITELFNQPPPTLGNQFAEDRVLQSYLKRELPADIRHEVEPVMHEMGELASTELYEMQLADRLQEPVLTQWDAWGKRIDQVEQTPLWKRAEHLAAEYGIVATAYERSYGRFSRIIQFALAYLFHPSTDVYTCPLAMTDGAARTLLNSGNTRLIKRALHHLTSRDPQQFWTSGQWMTELAGGSDVGRSQTIAVPGEDGQWRLYGRKWFTSAVTSQMALALARPQGNPPGSRGLALFYVEMRDENGELNGIRINRLKDKLGTRKLPTAELNLEGAVAVPVCGLDRGVPNIVPMLHLTRTWNSVVSAASMRRGVALARDYARRREAFGAPLAQQPLHVDTLAGLQVEAEAAFHLSFYLVELLGRDETGEITLEEEDLLRLLTSISKLTTGRQAVAVASEVLESFGGAGYVEDTGLPTLLRDSQVLPIWEGTTNVLSLDVLHVLAADPAAFLPLQKRIDACVAAVGDDRLVEPANVAQALVTGAAHWLERNHANQASLEAGARRLALTVGRALALTLLVEHAGWSLQHESDSRALFAARRYALAHAEPPFDTALHESAALAHDRID